MYETDSGKKVPCLIKLLKPPACGFCDNFSRLEVLGGHPTDWLFTHINIRLERDWVNYSSLSIFAIKGCLWLASTRASTKEFKHAIKAPLHKIFLSYICIIPSQHVFLGMHGL